MPELLIAGVVVVGLVALVVLAGYLLAREQIDEDEARTQKTIGAGDSPPPVSSAPPLALEHHDEKTTGQPEPDATEQLVLDTKVGRPQRKTIVINEGASTEAAEQSAPNDGTTAFMPMLERSSPNDGNTAFMPMLERSSPNDGNTAFLSMSRLAAGSERSSPSEADTEVLSVPGMDGETPPAAKAVPRFAPPGSIEKVPKPLSEVEIFDQASTSLTSALAHFETLVAAEHFDIEDAQDALKAWDNNLERLAALPRPATLNRLEAVLAGESSPVETSAAMLIALALEGDSEGIRATVFSAFAHYAGAGPEGRWPAFARALELWDDARATPLVQALFEHSSSEAQAASWLHLLARRGATLPPDALSQALDSSHPNIQAAALKLLNKAQAEAESERIERLLVVPDHDLRRAALEAGLLADNPNARIHCRQRARKPEDAAFACELLALVGTPNERESLRRWASNSPTRPVALAALGVAGTRADIEICLAATTDEDIDIAATAERSFAQATGFHATDDTSAAAWWAANASRFAATGRYLRGQIHDHAAIAATLRSGAQIQRRVLARELHLRSGGHHRIRVDLFPAMLVRDIEILPEIELD